METNHTATILILIMIGVILYNLGAGLYYLFKDSGQTKRTTVALKYRISLSILLFISLFIAAMLGYISPHGLGQ